MSGGHLRDSYGDATGLHLTPTGDASLHGVTISRVRGCNFPIGLFGRLVIDQGSAIIECDSGTNGAIEALSGSVLIMRDVVISGLTSLGYVPSTPSIRACILVMWYLAAPVSNDLCPPSEPGHHAPLSLGPFLPRPS